MQHFQSIVAMLRFNKALDLLCQVPLLFLTNQIPLFRHGIAMRLLNVIMKNIVNGGPSFANIHLSLHSNKIKIIRLIEAKDTKIKSPVLRDFHIKFFSSYSLLFFASFELPKTFKVLEGANFQRPRWLTTAALRSINFVEDLGNVESHGQNFYFCGPCFKTLMTMRLGRQLQHSWQNAARL